ANGDLIYCGPLGRDKDVRFVATRSSDCGQSWAIVGEIETEKEYDERAQKWRRKFNECHCLEVEPEHIDCALRTHKQPQTVYIAHSYDGGRNWESPQDLGVYGFPSKLAKLSDGRLICVFGDRGHPRQAIRAVLSGDNGQTWSSDNVLTIREFEHRADMGYPSVIETSPGELFCIYYYVPMPYPGEPCPAAEHVPPDQAGILSTRFQLA